MKQIEPIITEQDDLLISPYLKQDTLPIVLRDMLTLAPNDAQRDMLLLASLTSVSAVMPNLYTRYGVNGKRYFANLQTFIMAAAASGKGIAGLASALVEDIHAKSALLIPGDSSYPAFFIALATQDGRGLLFETEGSVITDTWRTQAHSYNTALRQAAEHEAIRRGRANQGIVQITNPQLSCLLTGTFDQFHALIPSVQNGFFSRLTTYVNREQVSFMPSVFRSATGYVESGADQVLTRCRRHVNALYHQLSRRKAEREFRLTVEQASQLGSCFQQQYAPLVEQLGPSFHASVVRAGITTMRILMILSALRAEENDSLRRNEPLYATQEDFQTAILITDKLILHIADSFTQIHGEKTAPLPASRTSVQRLTFLSQLPEKFTTAECLELGNEMGVSVRSVKRWLTDWTSSGCLQHSKQGEYVKTA